MSDNQPEAYGPFYVIRNKTTGQLWRRPMTRMFIWKRKVDVVNMLHGEQERLIEAYWRLFASEHEIVPVMLTVAGEAIEITNKENS